MSCLLSVVFTSECISAKVFKMIAALAALPYAASAPPGSLSRGCCYCWVTFTGWCSLSVWLWIMVVILSCTVWPRWPVGSLNCTLSPHRCWCSTSTGYCLGRPAWRQSYCYTSPHPPSATAASVISVGPNAEPRSEYGMDSSTATTATSDSKVSLCLSLAIQTFIFLVSF